jgi:hypothetical protein
MTQKKIEIRLSTKDRIGYDEIMFIRGMLFDLSVITSRIKSTCPVVKALAKKTEEQVDAIRSNLFGLNIER